MALSQEDKDDLQTADALSTLLRVVGWQVYLGVLDNMIRAAEHKVEAPCISVDGMVALESQKGALMGLRLARGVVQNILDHANEIRSRATPDDEV